MILHRRFALPGCLLASLAAQDPARLVRGPVGERIARYVGDAAAIGFHGSVLAARGGQVVAALGVGLGDPQGGSANDARTLFELASVTKQFTAAAILVLVQDGRVALDDPIGRHLPGVPPACGQVTIRHLLQHTSGMAQRGGGLTDDLGTAVAEFLPTGPTRTPGSHWQYWNQGYALLAGIVAEAGGEPFPTFCRRRLFAPAGCTTACFTGDQVQPGVQVAIGRSPGQAPRSALEHPYGSYDYRYLGMGGAVANVWDLWHWDRALTGDTVLAAASRREFFRPGLHDYALGWYVHRHEGRLTHQHGGSVRGFVCDVRRYPDDDAFVAVLGNATDGPVGEVANGVAAILFGDARSLPAPLPTPLGEVLLGEWSSGEHRLTFEVRAGVLQARVVWAGLDRAATTRGYLAGRSLGAVTLCDHVHSHTLRVEPATANARRVSLLGFDFVRAAPPR